MELIRPGLDYAGVTSYRADTQTGHDSTKTKRKRTRNNPPPGQ